MNRRFRNILTVLTIVISTYGYAQSGVWVQKDSIKGPGKFGCIGFHAVNYGYIGLGYDNNDYKRSLFRYDPWADEWTKMESLGGATGSGLGRSMAVAFVIANKAYIGLGQGGSPFMGDMWAYEYWSNTWQFVPGVGVSARRAAVAFTIGSYGYVGLGYDASGLKKDLWRFDPATNAWTQMANYGGTARQKAVALVMDNRGYVGLGDDGVLKDDFWKYDPGVNSWTSVANFPGGARSGACGFVVGNYLFVGTGQDYSSYKKDFWRYSRWTNQWTQIQDFGGAVGTPRAYAAAFALNGVGYVGSGYDGAPKDDFYAYEVPVGIEENNLNISSSIFPNPVKQYATIIIDADVNAKEFQLQLYNISGKKVSEMIKVQSIENRNGKVEIQVQNLGLLSGQYFYQVTYQQKQVSVGKFLVVK